MNSYGFVKKYLLEDIGNEQQTNSTNNKTFAKIMKMVQAKISHVQQIQAKKAGRQI